MKALKKFLKKIDLSGLPFTFKYKSKDKYSTSLGGLILIFYGCVVIYFVVYYLLQFIYKENFKIIYYTANIEKTDIIKLKDSKVSFSFGLDCESNGRFKAEDLLKVEAKFYNHTKTKEGKYNLNTKVISSHFCTHEDFFNSHNDSFDRLTLHKFQCLDDYSYNLQGIYADQVFTYYELTVKSKYGKYNYTNLDNIEEYFFMNDCKLQIVYTEKTVDLENYEEPIKSYLNEIFIQLNPTLYIKRNIFFMNQYLVNDDDLFGIFSNLENSSITPLHSRYEEYSLYLGLNRSKTRPKDYINYAKLYMRADTKKTDIRRTYQNLLEFYANISSLLLGIFRVLIFILNFFNDFYAEFSFSKRIFIFKEYDNNRFNISKKGYQIKRLKSLLDSFNINETESSSFDSDIGDFYSNEKIFGNYELLTYNKNKRNINVDNKKRREKSISYTEQGLKNLIKNINYYKLKSSNNGINLTTEKMLFKKENQSQNSTNVKNDISSSISNKILVNKNEINLDKDKKITTSKKESKNKYHLNIFEIICISFCDCCCLTPKLKIKNNLYKKIKNVLNKNLDVVNYIRNMLLFENMNEHLLNSNLKDIINFLYRPILSKNKIEEKEVNELNQDYKEIYFDKFCDKICELVQKKDLTQKEKQIILLTQQKLYELS